MIGRLFRRGRRVPSVLQMEAAECGAACLAMVLAAHGRWETLDTLRDSCGTSRDGTTLSDILAAARARGFTAEAFSRAAAELGALPLPQILFWNFGHFVVLEAVRGTRFLINDPAQGRIWLDLAIFQRSFTGITATFSPGPGFRSTARPPGTLRRLFGQLGGSWDGFAAVVLCGMLMAALGVLVPGLTQIFVDDYLVEGYRDWLAPLLAAIIGIGALNAALSLIYTRLLLLLRTKVNAVVSARFVWRLFHLPREFFTRRSVVEVSGRTQLATQLGNTLAGPVALAAVNGMALAGYAGVMLLYDRLLAAVVVAMGLAELAVLRQVNRRVREEAARLQMIGGRAHAAGVQGAALLEQARAMGSEAILFERMLRAEAALINAEQASGRTLRLLDALPYASSRLTTLVVLGVGALQVMSTEMTIGMLIGFLALTAMFSTALGSLSGISAAIGQSSAALARLGDALERPSRGKDVAGHEAQKDDPSADDAAMATGAIRLSGLGFAYPGAAPLFTGLELFIESGEMIGIMGGSGTGKSTIGQLLVGLLHPSAGEIGFETQGAEGPVWRNACGGIGYVDQQPFLPNGSLRNALTFWNSATADADIERALADAAIAEAVHDRQGGVDSPIGENGGGFSGGERQRLALARALVENPRILVLDDTTNALDEATEAALLENLRRRGLTLVLLTSRPSAIRHLDRALVLEDGRLHPISIEDAHGAASDTLAEAP